jgi:small subunit ribosomal protein S8
MTDPIADMLTRVRNALLAKHDKTVVPASKTKLAIARILKDEGYIQDYVRHEEGPQGSISIILKYDKTGTPAIRKIERFSRPGLRRYVGKDDIPRVLNGLGIAILSTSRGVMVGSAAEGAGVGGEVLCTVY